MVKLRFPSETLFSVLVAVLLISATPVCTKHIGDKVKDGIEEASASLKSGIDKLGDDLSAIQEYLQNYHWKGLIQDHAASGIVTLSHLEMNGPHKAVMVKPGERIEGSVQCAFDPLNTSAFSLYRVVLGFKGEGGQTTICNCFGSLAGNSVENFVLIAPTEPGVYQVRFRVAEALLAKTAIMEWKDSNGEEPDGTTTIGLIVVN